MRRKRGRAGLTVWPLVASPKYLSKNTTSSTNKYGQSTSPWSLSSATRPSQRPRSTLDSSASAMPKNDDQIAPIRGGTYYPAPDELDPNVEINLNSLRDAPGGGKPLYSYGTLIR